MHQLIRQLLTITATSIDYITKRTQFEQTNIDIPQTVQTQDAAPRQEYKGAPPLIGSLEDTPSDEEWNVELT